MLNEYDVMVDAILLKPNMILPGLDAEVASPADVAKFTVRTMMRSIPGGVPGIHFLSGGMSEEESTLNLQVRLPMLRTLYNCGHAIGRY
jgi:fructose-bisphosphate aldolase class I